MKKAQSIKRILSLLLCMALLLALFPVSTVFATAPESLSITDVYTDKAAYRITSDSQSWLFGNSES